MRPMLKQKQKWRHGEDGHMGDCYRTCIANYLGIDRDSVPHFVEEYGGPDGEDGESVQNAIRDWLDRRGLLFLEVALNSTLTVEEAATIGAHWLGAIDRVMVGGKSVNGTNHIVLWEKGEWFDSTKDFAGDHSLVGPQLDGVWWVMAIVPSWESRS